MLLVVVIGRVLCVMCNCVSEICCSWNESRKEKDEDH